MAIDQSMDVEGKMLEVIQSLRGDDHPEMGLSVAAIASRFADRYGADFDRKITAHWVGYVIRRKLALKTERRRDGYSIAATEHAKLGRLMEKYGLEGVNFVNSANSARNGDGGEAPKKDAV